VTTFHSRTDDPTLSVTKAAQVLGVHPNTVRAWSDQGRLRYYRINARGDRRFRIADLHQFLSAAERDGLPGIPEPATAARPMAPGIPGGAASGAPGGPDRPMERPVASSVRTSDDRAIRLAPLSRVARREQARRTPPRRVRLLDGGRSGQPTPTMISTMGPAIGPTTASTIASTRESAKPPASDFGLFAELADAATRTPDIDRLLALVVRQVRVARDFDVVELWESRGDDFAFRAGDRSASGRTELPGSNALRRHARSAQRALVEVGGPARSQVEAAIPIGVDGAVWGVLQIARLAGAHAEQPRRPALLQPADSNVPAAMAAPTPDSDIDLGLLVAIAAQLGTAIRSAAAVNAIGLELRGAAALRRVAGDIGPELGLSEALSRLVDHAMVLFEADRGAVFLPGPDAQAIRNVSRGLSERYLHAVVNQPPPTLPAEAVEARRPIFATNFRDDHRAALIRPAIVQEGYDTICAAPMFVASELVGVLTLYHDRHHPWSAADLDTFAAFASQAATLVQSARQFGQLASWAAHLESIQQLGARLSHLGAVEAICDAIATELREVIAHDNIRVYLVRGDDLVPLALQGLTPAYAGETAQELTLHVGQGITGWVAAEGVGQNLRDAENDPRGSRIAGTEPMDESMLLAPMTFEGRVLGVIVLSRHGLAQFGDDDLRLLEIYAGIAAEAIAHAEATERLRDQSAALERQLRSQRALLSITESILTTLDPRAVLEQIAERLGVLVGYDNLAIEVVDTTTGRLTPLTARGVHATGFLEPWAPDETGIATWVVEHNEPALVLDERNDPRVNAFRGSALDGSMIVVPLRGREGATGVLTLERLGTSALYTDDEFELVKLFAAQVSIALQNAEVHRAVEIRARTDYLTGLLNHGTFRQWLHDGTSRGEPFCLVMIDLDDFKAINDAFGHQAGDRLLRQIGAAIVAAGRANDLVFRYGGDEFAVLAPGTDLGGGMQIARHVLDAIHSLRRRGTGRRAAELEITASIGVAAYPGDATSGESILLAADRACFLAKRTGRNRIASAAEGLAVGEVFSLQEPTPVDPPTLPA